MFPTKQVRIASVLVVFIGIGCTPNSSRPLEWGEHRSPDGQYSVQMPGSPRAEAHLQGPHTLNALTVEVGDRAFLAAYADLSPNTPVDYATAIRGMADKHRGRVVRQSEYVVDGRTGCAFEVEINRSKGFVSGRMVAVGDRLYQLLVVDEAKRSPDADVEMFLDSFRLIR